MNVEVVSRRLLITSFTLSLIFLFITFIKSQLDNRPKISMCNNEGNINLFIQEGTQDILVNPIGTKEVLECLGKHLPYYDRTIDIIVSTDSHLISDIQKRYRIGRVIQENSFSYNGVEVHIDKGILIQKGVDLTKVYQRPLKNIDPFIIQNSNITAIAPQILDMNNNVFTKISRVVLLKENSIFQISLGSF